MNLHLLEHAEPAQSGGGDAAPAAPVAPVAEAPTQEAPEGQAQPTDEAKAAADKARAESDEAVKRERAAGRLRFEKSQARREAQAANDRAIAAEQRAAALESQMRQAQHGQAPSVEQYQNYDDFIIARFKYEQAQEQAPRQAQINQQQAYEQQQRQAAQQAEQMGHALASRMGKLESELAVQHPDLVADLKAGKLGQMPQYFETNPTVFAAIFQSDVGPSVLAHLMRNPEAAYRLDGADAATTYREIGRIEALVANAPKGSGQFAPPSTLRGGSGTTSKTPEKMSMEEYMNFRNKPTKRP